MQVKTQKESEEEMKTRWKRKVRKCRKKIRM
jgi:hypothetical protein